MPEQQGSAVDEAGANGTNAGRVHRLVADLTEARGEFLAALDAIEPERLARPGLAGEWSARELIAHLGYWAGHGAEAIHAMELGRAADFEVGDPEVDERNETVARVARQTSLETVRRREAASYQALIERLEHLEPAMLDERLADWGTLEQAILEDGPRHYREHAEALRR